MLRGKISRAMDGIWTRQQKDLCFHQSMKSIPTHCLSLWFNLLTCIFVFSKTRTVWVVQLCGHHLWPIVFHRGITLLERVSGRHSTRGMMLLWDWCFWFCFISQKMEVGSKALMTLSIMPKTLQVIWQRCRDVGGRTLLASVIMVIGMHVVGGDGYPRYEYVGSFS